MWGWSLADLGSTPAPIPLLRGLRQAIVSGPWSLHPGATLNAVATESTKHCLGLSPALAPPPPPRVIAHLGVVLVYTSTTSGSEIGSYPQVPTLSLQMGSGVLLWGWDNLPPTMCMAVPALSPSPWCQTSARCGSRDHGAVALAAMAIEVDGGPGDFNCNGHGDGGRDAGGGCSGCEGEGSGYGSDDNGRDAVALATMAVRRDGSQSHGSHDAGGYSGMATVTMDHGYVMVVMMVSVMVTVTIVSGDF